MYVRQLKFVWHPQSHCLLLPVNPRYRPVAVFAVRSIPRCQLLRLRVADNLELLNYVSCRLLSPWSHLVSSSHRFLPRSVYLMQLRAIALFPVSVLGEGTNFPDVHRPWSCMLILVALHLIGSNSQCWYSVRWALRHPTRVVCWGCFQWWGKNCGYAFLSEMGCEYTYPALD